MDFMKIITKQLIEIIEWTDDSRDTLSYRWPDEDKEIKNGAQLIVRESQQVQFVSEGQFADLFNPGRHLLTTQNIRFCPHCAAGSTASTPLQVRCLLHQHALVHGQQMGHLQPHHDARQGLWRDPSARLRYL
jgi:hypothetical protein